MTLFRLGLCALLLSASAAVEKGAGEGDDTFESNADVTVIEGVDALAPSPAGPPPALPQARKHKKKRGGPAELKSPVPLALIATDKTIPSLGGRNLIIPGIPNADSGRLTHEITGFRLRKSRDNYNREIVKMTGDSSATYISRKADMTFNGRTYLYNPADFGNPGPHAVVTMTKSSAAARLPPFNMALDKVAGMKYEINSYTKSCKNQVSIEKDKVDRRPLYSFARVSRAKMGESWKVVRIDCDQEGNPRGQEAYTLIPSDTTENMYDVHSGYGEQVGLLKRHENSETDFADGWLSAGEDPLLFGAVLMITMEPQSPTG